MKELDCVHKEGEIHSVVDVDGVKLVIRYGFYDERERETEEPVPLLPDLERTPMYGASGKRIVGFLQDACWLFSPRIEGADRYCCNCEYYDRANGQYVNACECSQNDLIERFIRRPFL